MNLSILIHNVKDKANVGSIYRVAFQFNAKRIYMCNSAEPGNTNTYKIERRVPIIQVDDLEFISTNQDMHSIALETCGDHANPEILYKGLFNTEREILIAIGNESYGFSNEELNCFDYVWTLDAQNNISYNVSHALAIALHRMFY